jgi:hypothetical protein
MASKHVSFTIPDKVVAKLANVRNKSELVTRLLCAHYKLNPDTLEPINNPNLENDEHGN